MTVTYSSFEEVKGLDTEETYINVKDAIESLEFSLEPLWYY